MTCNEKINTKKEKPVFFVANSSWYLWNFRKETLSDLVRQGQLVICICPDDLNKSKLENIGVVVKSPKFTSIFFLRIFLWLWHAIYTLSSDRPRVIFSFTTSANFLFILCGRIFRIPVVPNISGTGRLARKNRAIRKIFISAYAILVADSKLVIFQNKEDMKSFVDVKKSISHKCHLLHGSGVNLEEFRFAPMSNRQNLKVAFISRLIPEKGLRDIVRAILMLDADKIHLVIGGPIDRSGKDPITENELLAWSEKGNISYLGNVDNVASVIKDCDLVALPSYYGEGVPKILLEACAVGRPILTTDTPGCRVTTSSANGYKVPPKSPTHIAAALQHFSSLDANSRGAMGLASRKLAESAFDVNINVQFYAALVDRNLDFTGIS